MHVWVSVMLDSLPNWASVPDRCLVGDVQKTVLGAPGEAHIEKVQMEGTWGLWQNPLIKPKSPIHSVMTITDVCGRVCCSTAQGGGKQRASGRRWSRQPWRRRLYDRAGRWGVVCLQDVDQRWTLGTNSGLGLPHLPFRHVGSDPSDT